MKLLLLAFVLMATGCPSPKPDPRPTPEPEPTATVTPDPTPTAGNPTGLLYAITIDDYSKASATVKAFAGYTVKPWVRIVFDEGTEPSDYVGSIGVLRDVGFPILGEILDSFYLKDMSVAEYKARAIAFMNMFQSSVTVWEVGNEVGGSWLGKDVGLKIAAAYDYAKLRGLKTALTGYLCTDSGTLVGWMGSDANVPQRMKEGLDFVLVSHYERDCDRPAGIVSTQTWQGVFDSLGSMFPRAKLGFGEVGIGTVSESNNAEYGSDAEKAAYLTRYYTMPIVHPRWVMLGFWWWGAQDFIGTSQSSKLWTALNGVAK